MSPRKPGTLDEGWLRVKIKGITSCTNSMSFESLPYQNEERQDDLPRPAPDRQESSSSTTEHEQFGWNDLIVAHNDQEAAERVTKELGFCSKSKVLSEKEYVDPDKLSWLAGEVLLSITSSDGKPVERESLRAIMEACKADTKKHIPVRVARLAPGERFS